MESEDPVGFIHPEADLRRNPPCAPFAAFAPPSRGRARKRRSALLRAWPGAPGPFFFLGEGIGHGGGWETCFFFFLLLDLFADFGLKRLKSNHWKKLKLRNCCSPNPTSTKLVGKNRGDTSFRLPLAGVLMFPVRFTDQLCLQNFNRGISLGLCLKGKYIRIIFKGEIYSDHQPT